MEETKVDKARKILSDKEIDKCCEWLLSYEGYHFCDIPGVTRNHFSSNKKLVFSYDGKNYDLRYENLSHTTMPDNEIYSSGDFFLQVNSHVVLHTRFIQREESHVGAVNSIELYFIKQAVLGDWLEVIPQLVASAQKLKANKEQQTAESNAKELDENIDLGEYE